MNMFQTIFVHQFILHALIILFMWKEHCHIVLKIFLLKKIIQAECLNLATQSHPQ